MAENSHKINEMSDERPTHKMYRLHKVFCFQ